MGILNNRFEDTLDENTSILITTIKDINDEERIYIRQYLTELMFGRGNYFNYSYSLRKILSFYESKNSEIISGSIAELLLALIIRTQGFTQEYCFYNLEEDSIKKGYDGLYVKNLDYWLAESKSSYSEKSHRYKHNATMNKAYMDIKNKLSGETKRDPWLNALNHTKSAKSDESLQEKLSKLTMSYTEGKFEDIKDHNIIISSAIITDKLLEVECSHTDIFNIIRNHEAKNKVGIAINLKSIDLILKFLEEDMKNV